MGSPNIWYKACLEYFVQFLSNEISFNTVKQMSIAELESYIEARRLQTSEKRFFYKAGMVALSVSQEAIETSCDDMNAAFCGVAEFEDFIELDPEMIN